MANINLGSLSADKLYLGDTLIYTKGSTTGGGVTLAQSTLSKESDNVGVMSSSVQAYLQPDLNS